MRPTTVEQLYRYRLIAKVHYAVGILEVVSVLTHAEYDRGGWKDGCGC